MKNLYILFFVLINLASVPSPVYSQEAKEETHVIFVNDFSAKDYYTLLQTSPELRIFTIEEACIPLGLIAISYEKGYDKKQSRDYTQAIILKLISKNASYTSYTIEDLRVSCSQYRKDNSDE